MAQSLKLSIQGLYTYPSEVSGCPPGSLNVARNIDLSRLGLATPRRGFDLLEFNFPNPADRASKLFFYDGSLYGTYDGVLGSYDNSTGWGARGSLSKPSEANTVKTANLLSNLYVTSSTGLQKLDSAGGVLYPAGVPKGLHMRLVLAVGTGTAVADTEYVSYRYLIARKDANNNTIRGGVSSAQTVQNTTGGGVTKDVTVTGYLPSGIDNSYFIELYRTAGSPTIPGDEMQKCYELPLTNTDIANKYFTITDIVPDDLLGDSLYTSPSQQGIANDNAVPPLAQDICSHKGYLFSADVESRHRYPLTVIACGGSGLLVNDTLTISDGTTTEVYTAKAAESVGSKQFIVDTASASISIRIDTTVRSLVNIINQASTLVYAYLLSTGSDLPGKLVIERRTAGSSFTVVSNRAAAWSPQLASSANANQTSTNSVYRNGLMWSKYNSPEASPLGNLLFVGSSDDPIKRIISSKDTLFIFKQRDGAFILRGENEQSWQVTELDSTCKVVAPETVCQLNGLIYGLFENGICEVSETAVEVISEPIRDKIQTLYGTALQQVRDYAFSIPYETDGKLILCLPQASTDNYATYQLVYDVFNQVFSEWDLRVTAGVVSPEDTLLHIAAGNSNKVKVERKTYDYRDFADFEQQVTTSTSSGTVLTITGGSLDEISEGDLFLQSGLQPAYVTGVDASGLTVTVSVDNSWDTGAPIDHYKAIDCEIEWNPEFAGNPAGFKNFTELNLLFDSPISGEATVTFSSDANAGSKSVTFSGPIGNGQWGFFAWGQIPWGGVATETPIRLGVPWQVGRANNLTLNFRHRAAYSEWRLSGCAFLYNPVSTRTAR